MWEIVGSIAGVLSFVFAVYIYFRSISDRATEAAKLEIYKERLKNLDYEITSAIHSIDAIVQVGKQDRVTIEMLQNLARVSRGQLYTIKKNIERERAHLKTWRYGFMIESDSEIEIDGSKPEKKEN